MNDILTFNKSAIKIKTPIKNKKYYLNSLKKKLYLVKDQLW